MKLISARAHGALDYTTVLFLIISPFLFEMKEPARTFTFCLAIVHLVLTVTTDFEWGVLRIVPLKVHGAIELIVSIVLAGVAFLFRNADDLVSFYYYLIFSVVLFIVWALTGYRSAVIRRLNA